MYMSSWYPGHIDQILIPIFSCAEWPFGTGQVGMNMLFLFFRGIQISIFGVTSCVCFKCFAGGSVIIIVHIDQILIHILSVRSGPLALARLEGYVVLIFFSGVPNLPFLFISGVLVKM